MTFRVGDPVYYYGTPYFVENDYGHGVYRVGNDNSFADLVLAEELIHRDPSLIDKPWTDLTDEDLEELRQAFIQGRGDRRSGLGLNHD